MIDSSYYEALRAEVCALTELGLQLQTVIPVALPAELHPKRQRNKDTGRCISGALQHHLRDRVRLVRVPRRLHEQGHCPLGHFSLDASADGEPCLLDQLASPESELPASGAAQQLALEQLVDQLPSLSQTIARLCSKEAKR